MKDDQRVTLTKRLLLEGLLQLLAQKELDKIKVSELCAISGINRATFYRHYQQPRDILQALRRRIMEDVQAIAEKDQAQKNASKWLEDICQYFYDHAQQLQVLFKTRSDEDFVQLIQEICAKYPACLQAEPDPDIRRLQIYGYAGGIYYILRQWITEPVQKSPKQIAEVMRRLMGAA